MTDEPFTIYVMQSAHTDIGFTHPQEQIMLMYLDYYDRVLELCRQSAAESETHRFKWTCETFWQVRNYLTARPERLDEFVQYVRAGQIEITAAYLHFMDLIDPAAYRRSVQWAVDFCRQHDLPLQCAMHCDINGWPWAVADILAENNIPFFYSSVHTDSATEPMGPRSTALYFWLMDAGIKYLSKFVESPLRTDIPSRIPQAFWWQGPSGGKILHWLGEHYITGNFLGLSSPREFHANKTRYFVEADQTTVDEMYTLAQHEVPRFVERLRAGGYLHKSILIQTAGFNIDNSPPDNRWCALIQLWNTDHDTIKLRTATVSEWLTVVQSWGTERLPDYRVAWPDHWAHGLGSATARIAQARRTQRRRAAVAKLAEMSHSSEAKRFLDIAFEQELLSLEHTFNAWSTTARPQSSMNDFLQIAKELTFHRAELYLEEATGSALRSCIAPGPNSPQLHVPSANRPAVLQLVEFNAGDLVLQPESQSLVDSQGKAYSFQSDISDSSQFISVLPSADGKLTSFALASKANDSIQHHDRLTTRIETAGWCLEVDPFSGGLRSLRETGTDYEWVESTGEYAFGQFVHETVVHPFGREAVGNLARYLALDMATERAQQAFESMPVFSRRCLTIQNQSNYVSGPVFDAIEMEGEDERAGHLKITWRCYHATPVAELVVDWNKRWSDLPEAAYVAFPFRVQAGNIELETSGGFFMPGSHGVGGQLPGTSSTYYTVQRAAHITSKDDQLLWLPLDAPLVMTNDINYNRWEATVPYKWNGFIASMPVNHYWHTNFATSQRGFIRLRYRFISSRGFEGIDEAILLARPVDAFGWR